MRVLAFETSTEACSAALWVDGEVRELFAVAPQRHAELLLPMADELLAEAGVSPRGLDGLAFGRGPGSFTGVRIASGVVQGIAFAADLPVAPVSTLQALAQGAWRERNAAAVLAAFDARMGEVYWGAYRLGAEGLMSALVADRLSRPEGVALPPGAGGGWLGAGRGWGAYPEALGRALGASLGLRDAERYPHAHDVAMLGVDLLRRGGGVAAEQAVPVYLRDRVVHV